MTKISKIWLVPLLLFCLVIFGLWQWSSRGPIAEEPEIEQTRVSVAIDEPIQPIPLKVNLDPKKVSLGDKLFHEPKLSGDNSISCASCHNLNLGGTDNLVVSFGIQGRKGKINTPTVLNSTFNFRQFWDGRAETLEEQIEGPMTAENEMGSSWSEIIPKLKQSAEYIALFQALYSDGITPDNIREALATFERSLISPNSRFDKYLKGDQKALSSEEKEGYRRFKAYGCVACHQGINVGGNMFQSFGLFGNYFEDRGNISEVDYGRYNVTGKERDRYVFKVPTLRNITLTAPYFHDGSAKTLVEAVQVMARYQLGRQLSEEDIDLIVRFLISLTGDQPG